MTEGNKGFFTPSVEFIEDLTQVPGNKELLKAPNKKKTYDCDSCARCSHAKKKVRDEEKCLPEIVGEDGKVVQKEHVEYKWVEIGGSKSMPVWGKGEKGILIVCDELTSNSLESGKPIIGQEFKLLKSALKEAGLDINTDVFIINSVRGFREGLDKKSSGIARKACAVKLHEDIKRLNVNVILAFGYSATSTLLSHKLSITNSWDVYESYVIPDQEFLAHTIVSFSPRDLIWELKNRQGRYKEWRREKVKQGQQIPRYYDEAVSREIALVDNKVLRSDDYKVKWDRFIKALKSAKEHWNKPVPIDDAYDLIEILKDKQEILDVIKYFHTVKCVSNDVEATSLKFQRPEAKILCISLSDGKRNVAYMTQDADIVKASAKLMADPKVMKVAHNVQYEISAYKGDWDVWMDNVYIDTQLLCHGLDHRGSASNLKIQTYFHFGNAGYGDKCKPFFKMRDEDKDTKYFKSNQTINKLPEALARGKLLEAGLLYPLEGDSKEIVEENKRRDKELKKGTLTEDEFLEYNCLDSIYTTKLVKKVIPMLMNKRELDAVRFSTQGAITMAKMTYNGLQTNQVKLQKNIEELNREVEDLHKQILTCDEAKNWDGGKDGKTPLNYNSGQQLAHLFFDILKHPPGKKTASGAYSTDKAALEKLNTPMCKLILEKKALAKVVQTYLIGYIRESGDDGVVKCNFPLGLTLSWRSSSNSNNFQNNIKHNERLAKLARSFMGPFKGQVWKEYDFSAAENYCASIVSGIYLPCSTVMLSVA